MAIALIHFILDRVDGLVTWPSMRTSKNETNYGDVLVCDSIMRQVKVGNFQHVGFGEAVPDHCDRFLVRGSTYLHNDFNFSSASETIESARGEGTVVGLGAQSPTSDVTFLDGNKEARNFISLLNERCRSISVRGQFTADVVERLGGRNVRITGCPSLFHGRRIPMVQVPETFGTNEQRIGISTHAMLGGIFCRNPAASLNAHGVLIAQSIRASRVTLLFEQGVWVEFNIADRKRNYRDRLKDAKLIAKKFGLNVLSEKLPNMYATVETLEEWRGKVYDLDAMIGFRFHGNVVGLMQGRPCYFVVYDSRIEEFCKLYNLPFQNVEENLTPFGCIANHDWGSTNKLLAHYGAEMQEFWTENGFSHLIR